MECQICRRRKATILVHDELYGKVRICAKCRREFLPTLEEEAADTNGECNEQV